MTEIADLLSALRAPGRPLFYVSPGPFNILGMRHWLPDIHLVTGGDFVDGELSKTTFPASIEPSDIHSTERWNARILGDADVRRYIREQGPGGQALFLIFDEHHEALARDAGLSLCLPSAAARSAFDDKVATTRLGNEAGVRSVPNVLGRVDGYATLRHLAASLGPDLVVQLPFGDSGMTTYFISKENDYLEHAREIASASEVKIMRRIRCRQSAIEACVTRYGTVVGPLATELVGFPELTPYRGGWCGNEIAPGAFPSAILDEAADVTRRFGDRLAASGYRGVFGLDFLIDEDSGDLFLGELNPRITGVTPLSTQVARDMGCAPLLMLHLLEWLDVPHKLDVQELSARFRGLEGARAWGQLVIKQTRDAANASVVPQSGIWELDEAEQGRFARASFDTADIRGDREAFVLRTVNRGYERLEGTVLARLMAPGRLLNEHHQLEPRARTWISAVRAQFEDASSALDQPVRA